MTTNRDRSYNRELDEEQNPRLHMLESFKDINRVMTRNYLQRKKHEARYGNVPQTTEYRTAADAETKITALMQQLQSSRNYPAPPEFLPCQERTYQSLTGGSRRMLHSQRIYNADSMYNS